MFNVLIYLFLLIFPTYLMADSAVIVNVQKLTQDNNSIAPVFSPADTTVLAFTRQKYQGIYLLNTKNKTRKGILSTDSAVNELSNSQQAGFGFSWSREGAKILSRFEQSGKKQAGAIDISSKQYTALSQQTTELSVPVIHQGDVFFMQDNAEMQVNLSPNRLRSQATSDLTVFEKEGHIFVNHRTVNFPQTECWLPMISPDARKISFECWQGIYVYDIEKNRTVYLGKGSSVSWFPNSQQLLYEIAEDNGVIITSADIILVNYDGSHPINLTANLDIIARRPSISPDNQQIAFDDGANIYVADFTVELN